MSDLPPGTQARALMRRLDRAALATRMRPGSRDAEAPYASLVLVALDHAARPLLLVSTLADHTRNLQEDARVSLLFDGTVGLDEPLTGPRVSVQGRAARVEDAALRARYVARHPSASSYAGFADFALWRVEPVAAHLVAGFGRIHWIDAADLTFDTAATPALAEAETGIVAHMNQDHADAIQLCAQRLLGKDGDGWVMTGIDPEGIDLRRGGTLARLGFDTVVADAGQARAELVRLVKRAREQ